MSRWVIPREGVERKEGVLDREEVAFMRDPERGS
jgi:hypothetical protein